jgi:hypothetical protein
MLFLTVPPIDLATPLAPVVLLLPQWTLVLAFVFLTVYTWFSRWPGKNVKVRRI